MSETGTTTTTTSLYSEAIEGFLRARLSRPKSLPYTWHPPQPQHGWQDGGTASSQAQSRLLQLPKELRDMIYKLTMGGCKTVHVTSESTWYHDQSFSGDCLDEEVYTNDLYFDRCLETTTEQEAYDRSRKEDPNDCYGMASSACRFGCWFCERHGHCTEMRGGRAFETALLRVCGQVYREVTAALWGSLVFSFRLQQTLTTFVDQMAPLQKQSLQSLHISIHLAENGEAWTWDPYDLMTALASLPSLRRLHLSLRFLCRGDIRKQLKGLREGSLPLWEDELAHFRRPSLKCVTVTVEDSHRCRPYIKTATSKRLFPDMLQPEPWTTGKRAEFAEALRKRLLGQ